MERPKLIFITQDLPYPFNMGNKIRMFNILKSLSKHFDVTLACQVADKKNFANINQFDGLCKEVHATISKNKKSPFHRFFYKIKYWLNYLIKNTPKDLYYANHCGLYKSVIDLMKKKCLRCFFF